MGGFYRKSNKIVKNNLGEAMKQTFLTLLLVFALFFGGCANSKTAYTDRDRLMLMSEDQEFALGEDAKNQILKKEKLSTNKKMIELTKKVGLAIANGSGRMDYKWEFFVLQKDEVNAFCLPGGKIFVYEGLFKMATTEGELATVIAHEIAHAIARHGAERMSMQQASSLIGTLISTAISIGAPQYARAFDTAYGAGVNYGVILPYSRKMEYEADFIGIMVMKKAGYDPNEALNFWSKMAKVGGKNVPEYLSTHPSDENRIAAIRGILADI